MEQSLTVGRHPWRRLWSFLAGAGMVTASVMTIRHFYLANFPESIFKGSFCDISAFFNCDSSAFSSIAQFGGVPMGWFGVVVGLLVVLGALFPSAPFERTNKSLALLNVLGVVALLVYSIFFLKKLCLLCTGFYVFSILSFFLFWKFGLKSGSQGIGGLIRTYISPSVKVLLIAAAFLAAGAYGFREFTMAKKDAQLGGVSARVVQEYLSLAEVKNPSLISPFWTARATANFDEAPIRIIEYADFLCSDCVFLYSQLKQLKQEYAGRINIAFQHFPLEAGCNQVVEKNLHPGACDLALLSSYDAAKFPAIHDEIFENPAKAKTPAWRAALAKKYGVEAALTDRATRDLVQGIIATGAEYEKTSDRFAHGIRSTPTMIINNRMVIGTLPYPQLKAIVESLLSKTAVSGDKRFLENWVDTRPTKPKKK